MYFILRYMMQKRKVKTLAVATANNDENDTTAAMVQPSRRRRNVESASCLQRFFQLVIVVVSLLWMRDLMLNDYRQSVLYKSYRYYRGGTLVDESISGEDAAAIQSPFAVFPTLHAALQSFDLVGLYFAASWCPMSSPVTIQLDNVFRDVLTESNTMTILYVSSDMDESSYHQYMRPHWQGVPYGSNEVVSIKQYFATCARREMQDLNITVRNHEIPTLIVLGAKRNVLTYHGIKDVDEYGVEAIKHWQELASLNESLEQKYASSL